MGSKSIREGDSPSASASTSFLLPQRLRSRRGSLASLSSAIQQDKEALSQALDQIHSTASQTESLTAFNEYTSPPTSSSGPDSKGIAGELQGGLSGLYNRLRASVGTTRDLVTPAGKDNVAGTTSLNSPRAGIKSPVPSSKNDFEPSEVSSPSGTSFESRAKQRYAGQTLTGAFNDSLSRDNSVHDKPSTALLGDDDSKSNTDSLVGFGPSHAALTQARQPTSASLPLAEADLSAAGRDDPNLNSFDQKSVSLAGPIKAIRASKLQRPQIELSAENGIDAAAAQSYHETRSRNLFRRTETESQGDSDTKRDISQHDRAAKAPGTGELGGIISGLAESRHVRPFSGLDDDGMDEAAEAVSDASSDVGGNDTVSSRMVTSHNSKQGDVFTGPPSTARIGSIHDSTQKGRHQHLELSLRKSIAPPLITRSLSENPSLTRVSSSGTITDSLTNSAALSVPDAETKEPRKPAAVRTNTLRLTDPVSVHRDLTTMNVFSQVKNKVLNKQYWMKDQNAKDCFYCGDQFSTFRRKHHCSE